MALFFFFKQKTAYEIVDCDWSSDVCSSDLTTTTAAAAAATAAADAVTTGRLFARLAVLLGLADRKSVV